MTRDVFSKHTALISITDVGCEFAVLESAPDFWLQITVDDVYNDVMLDEFWRKPTDEYRLRIENKYHMLTDEQALKFASFYLEHKAVAGQLICQCEHGQSRSAAAILEFCSRGGIRVFSHDNYYPNKVVFRKVLKVLSDALERKGDM